MELNESMFGKPNERARKEEKYSFPVLTMNQYAGKGTSRKFVFNNAAVVLLGLGEESEVGFVFQEGNTYLANITGTAAEVTPIREIDSRVIGSGKRGPITTEIQKTYFDAVKGLNKKYDHWLDYVN